MNTFWPNYAATLIANALIIMYGKVTNSKN